MTKKSSLSSYFIAKFTCLSLIILSQYTDIEYPINSSTKTSIKQKFQRKYLIINGQAKYNLFGHWCFMRFYPVVFLAKLPFLGLT